MIRKKNFDDIAGIERSCKLCFLALRQVAKNIKPGITTLELDEVAKDFIEKNGGRGSFLGYRGYEYTTCISINEEVVHGISSSKGVKQGDLVGIDLGVK